MPAIALCSTPIVATANGNAWPLRCRNGAINVPAWNFYTRVVPATMALGYKPSLAELNGALCTDSRRFHDTAPELGYGYELAAAYNGWTFVFSPTEMTCR